VAFARRVGKIAPGTGVKGEKLTWSLTTDSPHAGELEEASNPLGGSAGGVATFGRGRRDAAVLATLFALLALTNHYLTTVPHERALYNHFRTERTPHSRLVILAAEFSATRCSVFPEGWGAAEAETLFHTKRETQAPLGSACTL